MSPSQPDHAVVTWRERAFLIDAVMVLMHGMERVPENDKSELPELQSLLERLMGARELTVTSKPPACDLANEAVEP